MFTFPDGLIRSTKMTLGRIWSLCIPINALVQSIRATVIKITSKIQGVKKTKTN